MHFVAPYVLGGGPKDGGSSVLFEDLADLRFCPRFDRDVRQFAEALIFLPRRPFLGSGSSVSSMASIPDGDDSAGSGSSSGGTLSVDEIGAAESVARGVVVSCGVSGSSGWSGASGDWYASADRVDLEGVPATTYKDDKRFRTACDGR